MTTLSPVDARPSRWRILSKYREGERTLAEWKQIFEAFPPEDFPLFKIEGSVATVVCRPGTGHPLQVFRCYNGTYSARAPAEDEVEGLDNMTVEELRLYRLDWPAHCQTVAQHLGLRGQIRGMPELPWFWRIGELQTAAVFYPYFMAVIREDHDADIVGKSLKLKPEARLIVPSLSNWAFDRLTELNIRFHVLADGTPAKFPDVVTATAISNTPPALTMQLDAIEGKTDQVLKHVEGIPRLVGQVAAINGTLVDLKNGVQQIAVIPAILAENDKAMRDQDARMAFLQQAITSSVRTALELVEQKIVKRQSDLCLRKLTEEELLLFLFLIGYRWKREQKKVFSKRNICWALGLSDQPHPEIVSRKQAELENAHPAIKQLVAGFRALNAKGEKRQKRKEISYNAMDDAERRKLGLDDAKEDDQ